MRSPAAWRMQAELSPCRHIRRAVVPCLADALNVHRSNCIEAVIFLQEPIRRSIRLSPPAASVDHFLRRRNRAVFRVLQAGRSGMPGAGGRLRLPSLGTESTTSNSSSQGSGGVSQLQKEQHRVVVMGAARVGKSSIISQFLYDKFLPRYRETVEELHRGEYELQNGASLTLDILDTSGAYQFPAMRALSISTADAFILVFSIDDADTWEEVRRLRDQILESRGVRVPIVVVGNKVDLAESGRRAISREIAETIALFDWECGYVECSAKQNVHIIDVFKELLVQAKVSYNLSPAVRRRRQSLPNYVTGSGSTKSKHVLKRNSCTVA